MVIPQQAEYTGRDLDRWLKSAAQGDRDALQQLYSATAPAVYAYALSLLKNRYDAEDVLQDCFVTLRTSQSYRSQGKPMAWIMTVTRNLCLKKLQNASRTAAITNADYFGAEQPDPEDRLIIESCMKVLNDQERQIVILHAVAGFTHRQIGTHLGLKTATVLTKYHRAIRKLRSCF